MGAEQPSSEIQRTTYFSGRVQGVGFRFTTEAVAKRFDVSGYVRNLPDGRVELVSEGRREEVERFQAAVEDAMRGSIREVNSSDEPSTGGFEGFGVRA